MIALQELQQIPFLSAVDGPYADDLARAAEIRRFPEGAVIFRKGDDSPVVYLVLEGEINLEFSVFEREESEVHRLGPGDLLGWSPLLDRHALTATARAATPAQLLCLEVKQIRKLCTQNPLFGLAFYRQVAVALASRLHDTRRLLSYQVPLRAIPKAGFPQQGSLPRLPPESGKHRSQR